jgi:hypothetical protein
MKSILIRGGGVAALTCAHLLHRWGFAVSLETKERPRLPAILLSRAAQELIEGVFELPGLFDGLPPLNTRIVSWRSAPAELPHAGVVISEAELLARLGGADVPNAPVEGADFTIRTSAGGQTNCFGTRTASFCAVELRAGAAAGACWIEALDTGWLFLITHAPGQAWLLACGDLPPDPLQDSRLVAEMISRTGERSGPFPTSPRIALELGGADWLACGSAALAFDPLCGDGTAHAVREGILASAVIAARAAGEDPAALGIHYRARLIAAFQRHLALCQSFYDAPGCAWWEGESQALKKGIAWCSAQLRQTGSFHYRLEDYRLRRI